MMPKYIDADLLKTILEERRNEATNLYGVLGGAVSGCIKLLNQQPAADVAPVKHGHWVYKMRELIRYEDVTGTDPLGGTQTVAVKTHVRGPVPYCSLCDALAADSFLDYCPRCGAKMDAEPPEGEDDE
jgi:hypothetical protein